MDSKRFIRDLILIFAAATVWLIVRGWLFEPENDASEKLNDNVKEWRQEVNGE